MKIIKNKTTQITAVNEDATEAFGRELGGCLKKGDLITLDGELGSGKTLLTAAIVKSIGVPRNEVSSPTYTIMKPYLSGIFPVYHWDFYRICAISELHMTDFFEILNDRKSVVIVEWASLFKEAWADYFPRYEISLTQGETNDSRNITYILKG